MNNEELDLNLVFRNLRRKHGARESLKLMAKLFECLYEDGDMEWLRRRQDLYDFDLYKMLCRLDPESTTCLDEPWAEQGPYIRMDNVDRIRELHDHIEQALQSGETPLMIEPLNPLIPNYLRNLADDLVSFYENRRVYGNREAYPLLYKKGLLYYRSLTILGEPVSDLFDIQQSGKYIGESDYYVENDLCSGRLLVVDESESLCWTDYEWSRSRLETFAREQRLCIVWFRKA